MTDASDDRKWFFVNHRGQRHGPSGLSHLTWCAERGYLLPTSLVWTKGQPDWLPAKQALPPEVFETIELPPPLPEPAEEPEEPEEPEPAPLPEPPKQPHRLLYKLLKNFNANVREFPARATRAGFEITRHRKLSPSTDIFEGEIKLGAIQAKVNVILGLNPVIGGIMKMTVVDHSLSQIDLDVLKEDAMEWFNRHWSGEERFPWMLISTGVVTILVSIASFFVVDALGPGREQAVSECLAYRAARLDIEGAESFDAGRALFRPTDWRPYQRTTTEWGAPIRCIVIPRSGDSFFFGTCDGDANPVGAPPGQYVGCHGYWNKPEGRWLVLR